MEDKERLAVAHSALTTQQLHLPVNRLAAVGIIEIRASHLERNSTGTGVHVAERSTTAIETVERAGLSSLKHERGHIK